MSLFDEHVEREEFYQLTDRTMVCIVMLRSGHEIVGANSVPDPEIFNPDVARKFSRDSAYRAMARILANQSSRGKAKGGTDE